MRRAEWRDSIIAPAGASCVHVVRLRARELLLPKVLTDAARQSAQKAPVIEIHHAERLRRRTEYQPRFTSHTISKRQA